MSLIADGLLIATCLTAAVYCFVLGRRLKQFANTEVGLGQQILQLNKSLDETRAALKEAQAGAKSEAVALHRNIGEARKLVTRLVQLIEAGSALADGAAVREKPVGTAVGRISRTVGLPVATAKVTALQAAAAVQLGDKPDVPPKPAADQDEIAPAEIDISELLAAPAGEQQLGFLPDATEEDGDEEDEPPAQAAAPDSAVATEPNTLGHSDSIPEASIATTAPPAAVPNNLLKVERMTL